MSSGGRNQGTGANASAPSTKSIKTKKEMEQLQHQRAKEAPTMAPAPFSQQLANIKTQASLERDQKIKAIKQSLRHASNEFRHEIKANSLRGRVKAAFQHKRGGGHER